MNEMQPQTMVNYRLRHSFGGAELFMNEISIASWQPKQRQHDNNSGISMEHLFEKL